MRAGACLHRHHAARLATEKRQQPTPTDPLAEQLSATPIETVRVDNMLGDIHSDRDNLLHGRLLR
jgi:hypothetical protein